MGLSSFLFRGAKSDFIRWLIFPPKKAKLIFLPRANGEKRVAWANINESRKFSNKGRQPKGQILPKKKHGCPDSVESVGHIQCYYPVLQLPWIAIHHGIWREMMYSISKFSTKLNDEIERAKMATLSLEARAEWGLTLPKLMRLKYTFIFKFKCISIID